MPKFIFNVKKFHRGFTIVELLVVIVVIGLLATIASVAFNGISNQAKEKSIESDKAQAKKQIELFYVDKGYYPVSNTCPTAADSQICLKTSPGNTLTYTSQPVGSSTPTSYSLQEASQASPSPVSGYRYYHVDVVNLKNSSLANSVQLAEFNFLNSSNARITGGSWANWNNTDSGNSVSNSNADSPINEGPGNINDGSFTSNKWLDFRKESGGFWVDFGAAVLTSKYSWYTANDSVERDMTSWKVYGSNDNSSWTLLSNVSGATITDSRNTLAGTWTF